MEQAILRLEGISKAFDEKQILDQFNLEIKKN